MRRFLLSLLGACAFAAPATGQAASTAEPFRLEDAIGAPDWLELSGSVRLRIEALDNPFVVGRTEGDDMVSMQSLLKAEARGRTLAAGLEILDARRIAGKRTGGAASEVDTLEPIQAYAAWRPKRVFTDAGELDLTIGRFTMDMGSRRLVARAGSRIVLQGFTGARATWAEKDGLSVMAAWAAPTVREPTDAASALDNEVEFNEDADRTKLSLVHVEHPLPWRMSADAYAVKLDERDGSVATRDRQLDTFGARLHRSAKGGALDFEVEYVRQTGTLRATTSGADTTDLKHSASMLHAEAGYSLDAPWSPRIAVQIDRASGDRDPSDTRSQRFDPLYGERSFDLNPSSLWALVLRSNLDSAALRIEVKPDDMSDAYIAVRSVKMDEARDVHATSGVRDITGASGRDVGVMTEVRWRRWLVKDGMRLTLGALALDRGAFMKNAPNATRLGDPVYGYAEIGWTF